MGADTVRDEPVVVGSLPAAKGHQRDWAAVCAFADANPGKWIRVGIMHSSVRSHLNAGRYPGVDPSKYESASRIEADVAYPTSGSATIYLRRRP